MPFNKRFEKQDDAVNDVDVNDVVEEDGAVDETAEEEQEGKALLNALLSVDDEVVKDVPMPRFGCDFKVKGISSELYSQLEKRCKYPVKDKRTRTLTEKVNQDKLSYLLISEACIKPNWSDPQLLAKYNTNDPITVIRKRLLLGEVTTLTQAIMDASGFTDDIEEIKN